MAVFVEDVFECRDTINSVEKALGKLPDVERIVINGGLDMVHGVMYHFSNYLRLHNQITKFKGNKPKIGEKSNRSSILSLCKHEITAYLNRLYQYQEFYKSRLVKDKVLNSKKKEIEKALLFRHNLTGKRKIDLISRDNSKYQQIMYSDFGMIFDSENHIVLQITTDKVLQFNFFEQQEEIMKEVKTIFIDILDSK